uniref:Uncharacterized protein K02A2.6-like n=1 Tax=Nicotiana tabacum TaxID=4097 RepID=A0A1S4B3C0_TOBAC|nr:PREDICTED: uncharacterized protein K02A2.6-like [Nicotiana tabacum]
MEVYKDDMLVKALNAGGHFKHLQETFDILRKHNMKLNPEKCVFEVSSEKFLGFLVSQRGIKVNTNKIKAFKDILDQLTSMKEVQRLIGRLDALSRRSDPGGIGEPTLRYFRADEKANNEALLAKLELLDEHRDLTHIRMVAQKQRMEIYYNRRANLRYFKVGDLILREVTQNTREINAGKLSPT